MSNENELVAAARGELPATVELRREVAPNHSNRMVMDEDSMAVGVALHAAIALDELAPA